MRMEEGLEFIACRRVRLGQGPMLLLVRVGSAILILHPCARKSSEQNSRRDRAPLSPNEFLMAVYERSISESNGLAGDPGD